METVLQFIRENERIMALCVFITMFFTIVFLSSYGYHLRKIHRRKRNGFESERASYIQDIIVRELKIKDLESENAHILKVNRGMCLRKEAITKEILNDLILRKKEMEMTLDKLKGKVFTNGEITNIFNEIYKCLKP
jgi:hypothetical protein